MLKGPYLGMKDIHIPLAMLSSILSRCWHNKMDLVFLQIIGLAMKRARVFVNQINSVFSHCPTMLLKTLRNYIPLYARLCEVIQ